MARTVYSQFNFRPKQVKGKKLIAASHTTGKNKLRNAAKPRHYPSFIMFVYFLLFICLCQRVIMPLKCVLRATLQRESQSRKNEIMRVNSNKDEKSRFQETNLNVPGEIAVTNSCPNFVTRRREKQPFFSFFFFFDRANKILHSNEP